MVNKQKIHVVEVGVNEELYKRGVEYLQDRCPNNAHMLACYEGVSFSNLARSIIFDRTAQVADVSRYLSSPKRFVLQSESESIIGVLVFISLPEFYREIEFEDYCILVADSPAGYEELLNSFSFAGRAEIVTFNEQQVKKVISRFSVRDVHEWTVNVPNKANMSCGNHLRVRALNGTDLGIAKKLSTDLPEESSPYRSLHFQIAGLPFRNYQLVSQSGQSVYVGLGPYCSGVFQVNYAVSGQSESDIVLESINTLSCLAEFQECAIIWRLRDKEERNFGKAIEKHGFTKIAFEKHLHLGVKLTQEKF